MNNFTKIMKMQKCENSYQLDYFVLIYNGSDPQSLKEIVNNPTFQSRFPYAKFQKLFSIWIANNAFFGFLIVKK